MTQTQDHDQDKSWIRNLWRKSKPKTTRPQTQDPELDPELDPNPRPRWAWARTKARKPKPRAKPKPKTTIVVVPKTTNPQVQAQDADPRPKPTLRRIDQLEETFSYLPLLAPLVVAGYFQIKVGTDIFGMPLQMAVFLTLAFEGGAFYLARLYEKTLVAGDSTLALRLGMLAYAAASSGLIHWYLDTFFQLPAHIRHRLEASGQQVEGIENGASWVIAGLTFAAMFIWSRRGRWKRRSDLRRKGKVDTQIVKFGFAKWFLAPIRTYKATRFAVLYSIESPQEAMNHYRAWKTAGFPEEWPPLDSQGQPVKTIVVGTQDQEPKPRVEPTDPRPQAQSQGAQTQSHAPSRTQGPKPKTTNPNPQVQEVKPETKTQTQDQGVKPDATLRDVQEAYDRVVLSGEKPSRDRVHAQVRATHRSKTEQFRALWKELQPYEQDHDTLAKGKAQQASKGR